MFWLNYMIVMMRLTAGLGLQVMAGDAEETVGNGNSQTAYIPWYYDMFARNFMEYRGFMWIEKEGFEEYMNYPVEGD